jgi:hypothetical protein
MLLTSEASADQIHRATKDLAFTESLGFRFVQPGETIGFLSRLNLRPNQETMDVGVDIFLGDGGLRSDSFAQTVRVRGEIWVSGDQYEIDVDGLRDRSWGAQDFWIPKARRRIEARFEGGGALSLERHWAEDGPHLTGWVKVGEEFREIVSGRIETEPEADFPYPKALALSLVDSSRERYRIEAEMLHTAPLAGSANQVKYLSCQSLSVFDWGGVRGHGIVEYLHRLDGNGDPIIPTDV